MLNKVGPIVQAGLRPEIGQYYYWVDSNFRTAAQGWTRADGTGPLDLWAARNPGHVFFTPETGNPSTTYSSQSTSFTAAMDEMINFRGDTLFVTPGAYTLGTVLTWDVPYATIRGPETKAPFYGCSPRVRNASITMGVATTGTILLGADADGLEVAHLRFVPTSAAPCFTANAVAQNMHFHDYMWDTVGIATDAGTEFMDVITTSDAIEYAQFEHFTLLADAAMGPMLNIDVAQHFVALNNFYIQGAETVGTWATALIDYSLDGVDGISICDGLVHVSLAGAGAISVLITGAAQTGTSVIQVSKVYGSIGLTAIAGGTAGDADLLNNYIATTEGGTGGTLYTT